MWTFLILDGPPLKHCPMCPPSDTLSSVLFIIVSYLRYIVDSLLRLLRV